MSSKTRWSLVRLVFVAMFALVAVGASAEVAGLRIPGISPNAGGTATCCNVGSAFGCSAPGFTHECIDQNICTIDKDQGCGFLEWFPCNGYCKMNENQ
jgi:hypothetical protein